MLLSLHHRAYLFLRLKGEWSRGTTSARAAPATASERDVEHAERASRESAEAAETAARAAAELVGTLDAARDAADGLRRVAAAAAHKRRVADRAAAVVAAAAGGGGGANGNDGAVSYVRERKATLRDGSEATFSVFGRSDDDVSVFVLPYDTRRKTFTLVEEYHPGPNAKMIGLVAGMFEPKHGGDAETAAKWELSEEARLKLGSNSSLVPLAPNVPGGGYSQDKYSSARFRPFLALDCVDDDRPRPRDKEEDITLHKEVDADGLRQLIENGLLNIPSTAFATMGLVWLQNSGLL